MNTIVKRTDKTYGGYDYIEYNEAAKRYHTGNSRAHTGHYVGDSITINVATAKDLKEIQKQLVLLGFERTGIEN